MNVLFVYNYFLNTNFYFKIKVFNSCHDFMQESMGFNDMAIISVKENDFRINFCYIRKDEAINKMKNANLIKKGGLL